ncbi:hypothetical protein [Algoriphagus vanfongensis]|uniref:hypothetical protein n=1 Tax=Algoriphagus vanfongensis TaxID=426371 RepID=UPI000427AC1D|nr:hypothetical protein [Algoriphagus vanfongensis]
MNWRRIIRFKIGDVPWEIPLNILLLLIAITVLLMAGGAYLGVQFAQSQASP